MSRTHHWIIAVFLTAILLTLGVFITFFNQNNPKLLNPFIPVKSQTKITSSNENPAVAMTVATTGQAISEQSALQKASQILPTDKVQSIQKVNFEGKLAYQIDTQQNSMYLNANDAQVLAITPRADAQAKMIQVDYQQPAYREHHFAEHEEHEHGEGDDDE